MNSGVAGTCSRISGHRFFGETYPKTKKIFTLREKTQSESNKSREAWGQVQRPICLG